MKDWGEEVGKARKVEKMIKYDWRGLDRKEEERNERGECEEGISNIWSGTEDEPQVNFEYILYLYILY